MDKEAYLYEFHNSMKPNSYNGNMVHILSMNIHYLQVSQSVTSLPHQNDKFMIPQFQVLEKQTEFILIHTTHKNMLTRTSRYDLRPNLKNNLYPYYKKC